MTDFGWGYKINQYLLKEKANFNRERTHFLRDNSDYRSPIGIREAQAPCLSTPDTIVATFSPTPNIFQIILPNLFS